MMWRRRRKLEAGSALVDPYSRHYFGWLLHAPTKSLGGCNNGMNAKNTKDTILADFVLPSDV